MSDILAKVLASSVDPTKTSLLLRGILMACAPVVMVVLGITSTDFGEFVDAIVQVVFLATSLVAAIQVVWGGIRKLKMGRWSHPDA